MRQQPFKRFAKIGKSSVFQTTSYLTIIIVMTNLNALVDYFLHPEIPYLDREHLIVGGITGIVSIVLFGLVLIYMRHLTNALKTITTLESVLPICSNCKKIRKIDSDPKQMDSWRPIESYIMEKMTATFSHGICPECLSKLYPEYTDAEMKQNDVT